MAWHVLNDKKKIKVVLNYLISEKKEIMVRIGDEKGTFTTRFIRINPGDTSSKSGETPELVIEKLIPEEGNSIIQSASGIDAEFSVRDNLCLCTLKFIGISSIYPFFGFLVNFPEEIRIQEKRRENRAAYEMPEFISVELFAGTDSVKGKMYELNVMDCSKHGLGILITRKDFDLLKILKPGDMLRDITFYASSAMIKVDGTVKHITKINEGKYLGSYILGIESPDIIESCKPKKS